MTSHRPKYALCGPAISTLRCATRRRGRSGKVLEIVLAGTDGSGLAKPVMAVSGPLLGVPLWTSLAPPQHGQLGSCASAGATRRLTWGGGPSRWPRTRHGRPRTSQPGDRPCRIPAPVEHEQRSVPTVVAPAGPEHDVPRRQRFRWPMRGRTPNAQPVSRACSSLDLAEMTRP